MQAVQNSLPVKSDRVSAARRSLQQELQRATGRLDSLWKCDFVTIAVHSRPFCGGSQQAAGSAYFLDYRHALRTIISMDSLIQSK